VVEIQTFGSIVNVRMHGVGTLLVTIYLNFPSIVRHTVLRWLSSRHFNTHGLSGGGKRGREVVGKPDKSFQRTHRHPTAARKCESKRRKKKEENTLFNPRNIASRESERTGRNIRIDNRSLIPFDFYYRDSLSVPRGNHVPTSFLRPRSASFSSSVFRPDD